MQMPRNPGLRSHGPLSTLEILPSASDRALLSPAIRRSLADGVIGFSPMPDWMKQPGFR